MAALPTSELARSTPSPGASGDGRHAPDSALQRSALALTADPAEATALVGLVMSRVGEIRHSGGEVSLAQMFRMLRESYHSVARTRTRRPMHDAQLTALAAAERVTPESADA